MSDILSQDARDVARRFNQWSITATKGLSRCCDMLGYDSYYFSIGEGLDTKVALRAELSLLVVKGLR